MAPIPVTFDSNTWQGIVCPERFPNSAQLQDFLVVRRAVEVGQVKAFLSETVVTLDAIPKRDRLRYLKDRPLPIQFNWSGNSSCEIVIGYPDDAHPGLIPVLRDRIQQALDLGFRIIPVSRLGGLPRPVEIQNEDCRIALSNAESANIWPLLDRVNEVITFIEGMGVGRAVLAGIAQRIQYRIGAGEGDWYHGLDQPADSRERNEIEAAFAEWADGDSVAVHVGYNIDIFCTQDEGKGAKKSVLNPKYRSIVEEKFGTVFMNLGALAKHISIQA